MAKFQKIRKKSLFQMASALPICRTPPKNLGLLELIRAKREWHWKPTDEELRKGFRGWHQRGFIPHFDAPEVTQFLTFQLHDAFPVKRRAEYEELLKQPDNSAIRRKIEVWLDRGHGECWLRRRSVAEAVEAALMTYNGKRYQLQAWVIMPNHIHVVVDVWDIPMTKLINSWKGVAAREANRLIGRAGAFWQLDYYDTLIRDEAHLKKAIRYTEQNPMKAFKIKSPRDWPWTSARYRDEYNRLPWQRK